MRSLENPPRKADSVRPREPDLHSRSRVALPLLRSRQEFILERARRARRIAHVGCADVPYTDYRLAEGDLLHGELLALNPATVGIDVDPGGVAALRNAFPEARVEQADVTLSDWPDDLTGAFDLVIAGEVLEHVPDAGLFLAGAGALLAPGGELFVSVPNACSPKIGIRALLGRESVHPDHLTYYGPRTLVLALDRAGFDVVYLASYLATPRAAGRVANVLLRGFHALFDGPVGEGLIALARPRS